MNEDENKTFKMTYSADGREEIEKIRSKYLPRESAEDNIERLRALDASVGKKATCASVTVGVIGTLIMGFGMSIIMTELGAPLGDAALPVGMVAGIAGMVILILAYPIYTATLRHARKKVAPEILRLTDELMR